MRKLVWVMNLRKVKTFIGGLVRYINGLPKEGLSFRNKHPHQLNPTFRGRQDLDKPRPRYLLSGLAVPKKPPQDSSIMPFALSLTSPPSRSAKVQIKPNLVQLRNGLPVLTLPIYSAFHPFITKFPLSPSPGSR